MIQEPSNIPVNSESPECEINAQVTARQRGGSKDELRYWKRAIRSVPDSPYLYIELQRGGIRKKISLETSNRAAAAHRAREVWQYVRLHGWDGYMAKFKPESVAQADPSIGQFIEAVTRTSGLAPKTLKTYVNSLRKIAGDIAGLSDDNRKYGGGKGHREWLTRINAIRLSVLTPVNIQGWKVAFIARAGNDPLAQRSARTSANSFMRCARSLFSKQILAHVALELPNPLPFADCQFEPKGNTKYRSDFDISLLIEQAREELAATEPEVFKIFCLATFSGLRRREIDLLPWSAFRWNEGLLRIEPTIHFAAKSEDSYSDIPLDPQVLDLFRRYREVASGEFVIESPEPPRPELVYNYYRAQDAFDRLISWLRSHGVRSKKPLHALRKEFGSQLCAAHGIYAASRALRHSSIAISAAFYTDSKARASVGLGHLLESPKIIDFKQAVA